MWSAYLARIGQASSGIKLEEVLLLVRIFLCVLLMLLSSISLFIISGLLEAHGDKKGKEKYQKKLIY